MDTSSYRGRFSPAQRFANYSLRMKLTLAFLFISICSVGLVAFVTGRVTSATLTEQVGHNLNSLANAQALAVGDLLARQLDALQTLSLNRVLRDRVRSRNALYTGDPSAIPPGIMELDQQWLNALDNDLLVQAPLNNIAATELRIFQNLFVDHVEVLLTDQYGALAAATTRPFRYYYAREEWWQAAYGNGQGSVYISLPAFDEVADAFTLQMALPLYNEDQEEVIGILYTTYRLNNLVALVALEGAGLSTNLLLPGEQLLDVGGNNLKPVTSETLSDLRASTEAAYGEFDFQAVPSLVSQAAVRAITGEMVIAGLGWTVVVHQERQVALRPVAVQQRTTFLLTLIIISLAAVIATGLARLLTGPIARLTAVANQVAAGDLTAQAPVEYQDEIGALAVTFNTMTGRLRIMLDTLERANQELQQFAYVVSHDLKAPLRAIASLSEWIEEDIGETLTGETRQQMDLLRGRVRRMEALIEGILAYSRVGRTRDRVETVHVSQLLADVVDMLAPPDHFSVEIAPGMPTLVTERVKLEQVFANLISNAVKYHHRTDGCVQISLTHNSHFYHFTVADDGPGIAPQYHEKVFGIFQTLQARDQKESTGVGLAVVKKIIESQGGSIHLDSAEGEGSAFTFSWPKVWPDENVLMESPGARLSAPVK